MPVRADDDGWESIADSSVLQADMVQGGEGERDVIDIDDDSTVQEVKAMPEPILPSKAAVDAHNLTHWPYRSWCPHCVAGRRKKTAHRSTQFHLESPAIRCRLLFRARCRG